MNCQCIEVSGSRVGVRTVAEHVHVFRDRTGISEHMTNGAPWIALFRCPFPSGVMSL